MIDFSRKKVAVAGYGVEGRSTALFLKNNGADVTVLDENTDIEVTPEYEFTLGDEAFHSLDNFDYVFRTAGLRPDKLECDQSKILTAYSLLLSDYKQQVIGVTGTKGKGTTSTLIHEILKQADLNVFLGGNIGQNPLDFIHELSDKSTVVMELSSYQLMDAKASPHAAVILMIEPDHLDWHTDMQEYIEAKKNLVRFQKNIDIAIYNPDNRNTAQLVEDTPWALPYLRGTQAHVRDGKIFFAEIEIISVKQVGLLGPHNLENICAAATVCWHYLKEKGFSEESITRILRSAIADFKGLPDRLEYIGEVDGITYINDTFSANPVALSAALASFTQPKVVIAGGYDKKIGEDEIVKSLIRHVDSIRHIVLIGQTAETIAHGLESGGLKNYSILPITSTMKDIVAHARSYAQKDDIVLLSPGHASFDMFKNYKDRGTQFKKAVREL